MGKPMGRHPIPVTYSQKPKKGPKRGPRSRDIRFVLCSSFDRLSKSQNRSTWPRNSQNLVKGQQAPNTHQWLVLSHFSLRNSSSNALSLVRVSLTCFFATTSCSVKSWITASFIGTSRRCSVVVTTYFSSTPWLSSSVNNWHAFSCTGWIHWETSITLLWSVHTCCWVMHFSGNLFILSTGDKAFSCACNVSACCCACWRCDSKSYNYGLYVRLSYI